MNNPFTMIADEQQGEVIKRWLDAKVIENAPSGWDLVSHDDEWGIYTIGKVKDLGRIAGLIIRIEGIDLQTLLSSDVVTNTFEDEWIREIKNLDEVYFELLLDYINALGAKPEDYIKITRVLPASRPAPRKRTDVGRQEG